MLGYYFELAARGFRRDLTLTLLMVVAIGIGIGASMTALTVYHVLDRDPYPGRSGRLYRPQLDIRRSNDRDSDRPADEPYAQLSWPDAANLLRARRARRQALTTTGKFRIESAQPETGIAPVRPFGLYATADFFPMFGLPFRYGRPWTAEDDQREARVVVISDALNRRFFEGRDSVGRSLLLDGMAFRVVGVLAPWQAFPRVYGSYQPVEFADDHEAYLPLGAALATSLGRAGSYECWGPKGSAVRGPALEQLPCAWLAMWVELDGPAAVAAYRDFLTHYAEDQHRAGRFERAPNVRLRNVRAWLAFNQAVPPDVKLQAWLAFGFLLVCLVNATGLQLARFMRRAGELSVRRALGATRRDVFAQLLVDAACTGLAGGLLGLGLAWGGTWLVRRQPTEDIDYASLTHLDLAMLAATVLAALLASLAVGLLPAWRACRVAPALQLKAP